MRVESELLELVGCCGRVCRVRVCVCVFVDLTRSGCEVFVYVPSVGDSEKRFELARAEMTWQREREKRVGHGKNTN